MVDDNLCIVCPPNTFFATETQGNQPACTPKSMPPSCAAGQQLVRGSSGTADDNECVACSSGTFKSTVGYSMCAAKPTTSCSAGFYFRAGNSAVTDDNDCIACPAGTFQDADASAAETCKPKSPTFCKVGDHLIPGDSRAINDHACVPVGQCPPGRKVASEGGGDCPQCDVGTFSGTTSNASSCIEKATRLCSAGYFVDYGTSATDDTSQCSECPYGSYITSSTQHSETSCKLKADRVMTCGKGHHVSNFLSRKLSDHACVPCGVSNEGYVKRYQPLSNSRATQCTFKQAATSCNAGFYIDKTGSSAEGDDWKACKACPAGHFKTAADSTAAQECTPKTTDCTDPEVLITVDETVWSSEGVLSGQVKDNRCVIPGRCPMGQSVSGSTCIDCKEGKYNKGWTLQTECTPKINPTQCPAGYYYSKPNPGSKIRDDSKCLRCPVNTYSDSVVTGPSTCKEKGFQIDSGDQCPHGREVYRGDSATTNDWYCIPSHRYTALCANIVQKDARSVVPGFVAGLPERIAPFTKSYSVTMAVEGYTRASQKAFAVVTGERFISAAEKVPFPEGLPLLTLHDPPGGASFASYENVRATTEFIVTEGESDKYFNFEFDFSFGFDIEGSIGTGFTPVIVEATDTEKADGYYSTAQAGSFDRTMLGADTNAAQALTKGIGNTEFTFTYTTSAEAGHAGSNSDAFLMPAATFEITEVWVVRVSKVTLAPSAVDCLITGRSDKSLSPRPDLDAFYFTTANDVETRTLPVLKLVADDTKHLIDCQIASDCCTPVDEEFGCTATTLDTYCDWRHGISGDERKDHEGWAQCSSIELRNFKTVCKRASGQGTPLSYETDCLPFLNPSKNYCDSVDNETYVQVGKKKLCQLGKTPIGAADESAAKGAADGLGSEKMSISDIKGIANGGFSGLQHALTLFGVQLQCQRVMQDGTF